MPTNTVEVNAKLCYADGTPAEGVKVIAELQSASQTQDSYILQKSIKTVVDSNGCITLNLWPNEAGCVQSFYKIEAYDEILGELLHLVSVVPESSIPVDLEDISMPVTTFSLANSSGNVPSIRQINTAEGIKGGGDLSQNRTHQLDLTTITVEEAAPDIGWIIPVQNPNNPCEVRYAKLGNLPGVGFEVVEEGKAIEGQTEILIESSFAPDVGQIEVYVNGKYQCPSTYCEKSLNNPPYNGKIIFLNGSMEDCDLWCVKIRQNAPFGASLDASQVTYSGGGTVETALDTLFSQSGASPWQTVTGDVLVASGERIFVSTDAGPLTITLPSTPSLGDSIRIIDITSAPFIGIGNSLNNDFTVLRNGENIMEIPDDLTIDQAKVSIELIYSGLLVGWVLSE